jgi:hypothetical protein
MRHAVAEGLRAGWDDVISSAVLAREVLAALLHCIVDTISGKPMPRIDLKEAKAVLEPETRRRRNEAA